ncbi:unnamed protein product [Rotaria sp. Silwood2]|nr:unnamed protein product [Rotaria sp. Silwood2]
MIPPNLLINPGAEDGIIFPWIDGGPVTARIDNGSINTGCHPYRGDKYFHGGISSTDSNSNLTQSILLLNDTHGYTEAQLDSGNLSVYVSFYELSSHLSSTIDRAQISLAFRTLNHSLISTTTTPTLTFTYNWTFQSFSYPLSVGTRYIDYIMIFNKDSGQHIDACLDDNSLKVY